jgi:RNA polymerase sigma factor (sigma-70 family)
MRNENALAGQAIPQFHSPNPQSDEALMKAIATGDQSAMRTLYARHNVRIYHFIARLVTDAGRAEDLVSEVFIDVWRQADRFEGRSQVSTWILSIARFKALSALSSAPGYRDRRDRHRADRRLRQHARRSGSQSGPQGTIAHLPRADVARPPRNPRPRLLSGKVSRGGRRGHPDTEEHGEDSHVLRSQTVSAAIVGTPGLRSPHSLPGGLRSKFRICTNVATQAFVRGYRLLAAGRGCPRPNRPHHLAS